VQKPVYVSVELILNKKKGMCLQFLKIQSQNIWTALYTYLWTKHETLFFPSCCVFRPNWKLQDMAISFVILGSYCASSVRIAMRLPTVATVYFVYLFPFFFFFYRTCFGLS
jgi:hypothetical protein